MRFLTNGTIQQASRRRGPTLAHQPLLLRLQVGQGNHPQPVTSDIDLVGDAGQGSHGGEM